MIRVPFDPATLQGPLADEFARWQRRAEQALDKARTAANAGDDPNPESSARVYQDFKRWLLEHVFHHKCAYCEGDLAAQTTGAAEHFRPKRGVTHVDADGRTVDEDHEGYWWLAFSWENLVPACPGCNTAKGIRFPISGTGVTSPTPDQTIDQVDAVEQPLLLHPFRGPNPAERIGFRNDGFAFAKCQEDPLATATINICDLNRWGLRRARKRRQREAIQAFIIALDQEQRDGLPVEGQMSEYDACDEHFSQAVKDALSMHVRKLNTTLSRLPYGGPS